MKRSLVLAAPLALALLAACRPDGGDVPAGAAPEAVTAAPADADAARRIEADVRFLADDLLEGRAAGTRGYDLAARYVANRFRALGLQPAGDDGSYFQKVPLLEARRVREGAAFTVQRGDGDLSFVFQDEFLPGLNFNAGSHVVNAPLVFVGQAVHAPELGHDDFEGVDVRGRIAVLFGGAISLAPAFIHDILHFVNCDITVRLIGERRHPTAAVGMVAHGPGKENNCTTFRSHCPFIQSTNSKWCVTQFYTILRHRCSA